MEDDFDEKEFNIPNYALLQETISKNKKIIENINSLISQKIKMPLENITAFSTKKILEDTLYTNQKYFNNLQEVKLINSVLHNNINNLLQNHNFNIITNNFSKALIDTHFIDDLKISGGFFNTSLLKNYSSIMFDIPSTEIISNLNSSIQSISDITENLRATIYLADVSNLSNISFNNSLFNVEFPKNISISTMETILTAEEDEEYKAKDFDYKAFQAELKLIDFTNDLSNVMVHYSNAILMANDCIDNSIKQKIYEAMINGIIELISNGFILLAVFILYVVLHHYLKDCIIYKHFIEVMKEAKNELNPFGWTKN